MKKKLFRAILLIIVALTINFCTDASLSKLGGYGSEFKVEMVNCDGSISHTWVSSGKVQSEDNSDGYYFNDKKTGKLIEITGRLIITKLN